MAEHLACRYLLGALSDQALTGQSASAIIAALAFSAPFTRSSQMCEERACLTLILPDVAIDGLVADRKLPAAAQDGPRPVQGFIAC